MENFKSIKILLDFADEDGKRLKKEQTIKVNTPSLKDKSHSNILFHVQSVYTLSFTISIPEFIHSFLIGKTVPTTRGQNTRDYSEDTAKSINGFSIENVTERWCELISDYVWLKTIEKKDLKKVIFYVFNQEVRTYQSYYNSTFFGESSEIGYKYATGYISDENDKQVRYNNQKRPISQSQDNAFYKLKYVEWTPEREQFFVNIQNTFEKIAKNIVHFESSISEETINNIVTQTPFLLTN